MIDGVADETDEDAGRGVETCAGGVEIVTARIGSHRSLATNWVVQLLEECQSPVQADRIKELETSIEALCKKTGFPFDDPKTSEFKWSPRKGTLDARKSYGSKP